MRGKKKEKGGGGGGGEGGGGGGGGGTAVHRFSNTPEIFYVWNFPISSILPRPFRVDMTLIFLSSFTTYFTRYNDTLKCSSRLPQLAALMILPHPQQFFFHIYRTSCSSKIGERCFPTQLRPRNETSHSQTLKVVFSHFT